MDPELNDLLNNNIGSIKTAGLVTKAVNNPLRQKILSLLLSGGPTQVKDLCEKLETEQSVMSQHLAILREVNLVKPERSGKSVFYSVNEEYLQTVIDTILFLLRDVKK